MKLLSIVVPVYNTMNYLPICLDSLLIDTILDRLEIIIVNDGSKDNSMKVINEYKKNYPNQIVVVDKENGGHGSTINAGLKIATGKYFKVLDSDDWVNSIDFIEFINRLEKENADLVITNSTKEIIASSASEKIVYKNLKDNCVYNFNNFDFDILAGEYFTMYGTTFKTCKLKEANFQLFEKCFYVDMQFIYYPMPYMDSFVYYDLSIYRYFIGRLDQSVNLASFVRNKENHERVVKSLIDYYLEKEDSLSEVKKTYLRMILKYILYTHYSIYIQYDKNKKEARKEIKRFDDYLKEKSLDLYQFSEVSKQIKFHRKTNFFFVGHFNRLYETMIRWYYKFHEMRRG